MASDFDLALGCVGDMLSAVDGVMIEYYADPKTPIESQPAIVMRHAILGKEELIEVESDAGGSYHRIERNVTLVTNKNLSTFCGVERPSDVARLVISGFIWSIEKIDHHPAGLAELRCYKVAAVGLHSRGQREIVK